MKKLKKKIKLPTNDEIEQLLIDASTNFGYEQGRAYLRGRLEDFVEAISERIRK